jgi:hypothetical protein
MKGDKLATILLALLCWAIIAAVVSVPFWP